MADLLENTAFIAAVISFIVAQVLKPILNAAAGKGWEWHLLKTTGGMPSSHSSTATAITSSIAMTEGLASPLFALAFFVTIVIMNDAMNVRYETGKHSKLLNEWSQILSDMHKNGPFSPQNFKTMVGHSSIQVIAGAVLGLTIGILYTYFTRFHG